MREGNKNIKNILEDWDDEMEDFSKKTLAAVNGHPLVNSGWDTSSSVGGGIVEEVDVHDVVTMIRIKG